MKIKEKIKIKINVRWLLTILGIIFGIGALIIISCATFTYRYEGKIYPGVQINNYDLGGLTTDQAQQIMTGDMNPIFENGFVYVFNNEEKSIPINHDQNIFNINYEKMADDAYQYARNGNFLENFYDKLKLLISDEQLDFNYYLNKEKLAETLQVEFGGYENPMLNPQIEVDIINSKAKEYELYFTEEKAGQQFDYQQIIEQTDQQIAQFNNSKITISLQEAQPQVSKQQAEDFRNRINELLNIENIKFIYDQEEFEISWEDFTFWLEFTINEENNPELNLNEKMVKGQLEAISQNINQQATNARFQMKEGRVIEFEASEKGQELDINATYNFAVDEIINNNNNTIDLIVNETEPEITTDSLNELGIKELVGVGHSNFSGSPANRRHNIGIGAATLHGVLVAPDEEFSLVKNLGSIDAGSGYLPELVIKENKTVPEYGGGLCQIATTMFRVALDAGLPITERKPHTYRVSYYEPAGMDAAVYVPHPDMRFVNDTGNYLLIQTYISGNDLTFELYGTSDGRSVEITDPKIFNITYPGPTKYVETTELAPGVKKWVEGSHAGADAVFYRTITYADDKEPKEEEWRSHYTAWQAVCLVGVDPSAAKTE